MVPAMNATAINAALRRLGLGAAIFAAVLLASLPLAFVDQGLALGAAVGSASVMIALLARRLQIALMAAALMAVLGAFAATHSIHIAMGHPPAATRLAQIAPAAGPVRETAAASVMLRDRSSVAPAALVLPARAEFVAADGTRSSMPLPAGWTLPLALFVLWALGYGLVAMGRRFARRLTRVLAPA